MSPTNSKGLICLITMATFTRACLNADFEACFAAFFTVCFAIASVAAAAPPASPAAAAPAPAPAVKPAATANVVNVTALSTYLALVLSCSNSADAWAFGIGPRSSVCPGEYFLRWFAATRLNAASSSAYAAGSSSTSALAKRGASIAASAASALRKAKYHSSNC